MTRDTGRIGIWRRLRGWAASGALTLAFLPLPDLALAKSPPTPVLDAGAVAAADRYAATTAAQIMKAGGNAVDAAVAMAFSLAVTYPEAGNIGGGGFMTLYVDGKPYFLDYRERAPVAATRDMYLDAKGEVVKDMSLVGYRAAGVPGTVDGMWQAHRRFGRLPWKAVLAPAVALARDGFVVDAQLIERRDAALKTFAGRTNFAVYFGGMREGQVFRQPELASTLERIANDGAQDFYRGKTADLIEQAMRGHGLIDRRDLANYKAVWRAPIQASWQGYDVITAPPPSSGGIGLVQLLKMKAARAADFQNVELNSPQYIHLLAEIEKRVFADRAQYLGDPDAYKVPVARLTDDAYIARRAAEVRPDAISPTRDVQPGLGTAMPERAETTHFSVVDKWGNAVSNTYTINGYFGAGVIVSGAGFLLNDEMDDFSAKTGVPNMFGVVGSDANAIAPGKRPLSSMTPTILTRDGRVALVVGTPGGSRIFTTIFQVVTNLYDFHLPLAQAVAAMRFHHQLLPENTLYFEPYMPATGALAEALKTRGYVLQSQAFNGDVEAIQVLERTPLPVADPRGRGVTLTIR
ncbi:gamma-glutamyltransferase [Chitinasiproducens palmae]|uniref:Glutathione hydrolase proenzyme n=1 Tax=Chitinasiproducens palmae TaxID=1770053 RepID=A0A1H2PTR3_9BURK|nr:gamma-glutamyltransferase [Chitinasiproducens palmae]SDV50131.1 gamma-glutamyltransferase 1 Threonine peptidase. MEROPS family T03 [Chitinasiproducens palmae]